MRPHTVGPDGIRIRNGLDMDVHVTWDDVYSVGLKKRTCEPKTPNVIDDNEGHSLVMNMTDQSNVEIVLERPTPILLPGLAPYRVRSASQKRVMYAGRLGPPMPSRVSRTPAT